MFLLNLVLISLIFTCGFYATYAHPEHGKKACTTSAIPKNSSKKNAAREARERRVMSVMWLQASGGLA